MLYLFRNELEVNCVYAEFEVDLTTTASMVVSNVQMAFFTQVSVNSKCCMLFCQKKKLL